MRYASSAPQMTRDKHLPLDLADDWESNMQRWLRDANDSKSERDLIALLLLYRTGARPEELLMCRGSDFDYKRQTLYFRALKGSNDRELGLPNYLARRMHMYLMRNSVKKDDKVFTYGYYWLVKIWKEYRPAKKAKLYCLRHTAALKLYDLSRDIILVKNFLGHKSIQSTMVYLEYWERRDITQRALWAEPIPKNLELFPEKNPFQKRNEFQSDKYSW